MFIELNKSNIKIQNQFLLNKRLTDMIGIFWSSVLIDGYNWLKPAITRLLKHYHDQVILFVWVQTEINGIYIIEWKIDLVQIFGLVSRFEGNNEIC